MNHTVVGAASTLRKLSALLAACLLAVASLAGAQEPDAGRYFQQCELFESRNDLETAREFCLNALQLRADFPEAQLALARIEVGLGDYNRAADRLRQVRNRIDSADPLVLLARVALARGELSAAEAYLNDARLRLSQLPDPAMSAQLALLGGELNEARGEYRSALTRYGEAIAADPQNPDYRLHDARLRLRLNDPEGAEQQLSSYVWLSGDERNSDVRSLIGQAQWTQGELANAEANLSTAQQLRGVRESRARGDDLRALAFVSFSQGKFASGWRYLLESLSRSNLVGLDNPAVLLWLVALLALLATHLLAESGGRQYQSIEETPSDRHWSLTTIYGSLFASLLIAAAAVLAYGHLVLGNMLAFLTPGVRHEISALFLLLLALLLTLFVLGAVKRSGFDAYDTLLGSTDGVTRGVGWGLLFVVLTGAYLYFFPSSSWGRFTLDFVAVTPIIVAAAIILPLAELFFRPFVLAPFNMRYRRPVTLLASALLSTVVLGTPVLLLSVFGLVLGDAYLRRRNGWEPLVAQLTLNVGLLAATAVSPWVRALFF